MKSRRNKITDSIRDQWVSEWTLANNRNSHYVPFVKTQDLKSCGSKSRSPDFEEKGKDLDLLSTNERHFFYRLRFSKKYLWIKEQYPLLPLARTLAIAKELSAPYPIYKYSPRVKVILTTDFYCQTILGHQVAYSIKDVQELTTGTARQRANVEIKLKIEKAFWETQGVKWHLITSDTIKDTFSQNLEQLFPFYLIAQHLAVFRPRWLAEFDVAIKTRPSDQLHAAIEKISNRIGISYTDSVQVFQHCLWNRLILANLTIRLRFERRVSEFQFEVVRHD